MTTYVEHVDHGDWQQTGRCVYCACGARLFNGGMPRDRREFAAALDALSAAVNRSDEQGEQREG